MGFVADNLDANTYKTLSTTVGAGIVSTYYDRRFLDLLVHQLVLSRFAQLRPLPEGNGTTVEFTRPRGLAPATTALTEGLNPNATKLYFQKVNATLKEYGDVSVISSLNLQAHMLNDDILGAAETFGAQSAETMELLLSEIVCSQGIYPVAADLSATSKFSGVLGTVTSTTVLAGGAALEANTNYGDTDHDLRQSIITILSGPAAGQSRIITAYDADGGATGTAASGKMTVSPAFDMTPVAGDSYIVVTPDEITTGDDLSYANLGYSRMLLKKYHAKPVRGQKYACVVSPEQSHNLSQDTDWKAVNVYKERTTGLEDLMLGSFAGFNFYETTQPFAFPITTRGADSSAYGPGALGANYSATGAVQCALCIGKDAFAATSFKRKSGQVMKPPIKVKYPNKYDKSDPLDRHATVGWVMEAGFASLYSAHCIGIWTSI